MEVKKQVDADIRIYNDEKTLLGRVIYPIMVVNRFLSGVLSPPSPLCIPMHVTERARTGSVSEVRNSCLGQTKQRASERESSRPDI